MLIMPPVYSRCPIYRRMVYFRKRRWLSCLPIHAHEFHIPAIIMVFSRRRRANNMPFPASCLPGRYRLILVGCAASAADGQPFLIRQADEVGLG